MIKAIIFDCFGVLVRGSLEPFRDTYLAGDTKRIAAARDLDKRSSLGHISYDEFVSKMAQLAKITPDEARTFLDDNPRNTPLLNYIADRLQTRYKLGFLSNASDDWLAELFLPEQVKLFDDIVLSFQVGLVKPDPAIYKLAAKRLGVEVQECLLVDDIERYCTGAKEIGMHAMLYKDFDQCIREIEHIIASHQSE